ncbi:MAG: metallophosphoesterase [Chitinophagaceae bacterium]|nr:metallophosphoesterase [Chitinophagaceae bacterium]
MVNGKEVVLVTSDLHIPFHHPNALEFLVQLKKKYKPTKVVCIGDELDMHAMGRWPKNPDGRSIGDELILAIDKLKPFYKEFPNVMSCVSNHTSRPYRQGFEFGLSTKFFKDYREWMEAPIGWEWRDYWEIDGVRYIHGEGFSGAQGALKAAMAFRQSTVIGHLHTNGGVIYSNTPNGQIFGMNVGCLIDPSKYAFAYAKNMANKPTLGAGIVVGGKYAIFIPME